MPWLSLAPATLLSEGRRRLKRQRQASTRSAIVALPMLAMVEQQIQEEVQLSMQGENVLLYVDGVCLRLHKTAGEK